MEKSLKNLSSLMLLCHLSFKSSKLILWLQSLVFQDFSNFCYIIFVKRLQDE